MRPLTATLVLAGLAAAGLAVGLGLALSSGEGPGDLHALSIVHSQPCGPSQLVLVTDNSPTKSLTLRSSDKSPNTPTSAIRLPLDTILTIIVPQSETLYLAVQPGCYIAAGSTVVASTIHARFLLDALGPSVIANRTPEEPGPTATITYLDVTSRS